MRLSLLLLERLDLQRFLLLNITLNNLESYSTVGGFQTRKPQQRRVRSDPFDFARTGSPDPNCPSPKASDPVASLLSWLLNAN